MAENRRDVLSGLETIIDAISEVTTTVRTYAPVDILNYKEAEMPLVNIIEPGEDTYQDMTSHRAIMSLGVVLKVWFVSWAEVPTSTYETLMKEIRDAIGANFTLGGAVDAAWVDGVTEISGEMPVYNYGISMQVRYYLNAAAT